MIEIDGGLAELAFMILFGVLAAGMADSRGRNPVGWFVGGFLFHVLALILLAVLSNKKEEGDRWRHQEHQTSRLRERMRHDRSVGERRYQEIERRLRAHDVALGLDTVPREGSPALEGVRPPSLPETGPEVAAYAAARGTGPERIWYFSNDARSRSAAPAYQLRSLYRDGRIWGTTLVWTEGMRDWRALSDVPELEDALRG